MAELIVNPSKVNLAEIDIEEWLYNNPQAVSTITGPPVVWIGRQFSVPSGIIDLLGKVERGRMSHLVVVEVKNVEFSHEALCQVARYAGDILAIQRKLTDWDNEWVEKILIGKGQPSSDIQFSANAMDINLRSFEVRYSLTIGGSWNWNSEVAEKHESILDQLVKKDIFEFLKPVQKEEVEAEDAENSE